MVYNHMYIADLYGLIEGYKKRISEIQKELEKGGDQDSLRYEFEDVRRKLVMCSEFLAEAGVYEMAIENILKKYRKG